MRSMERRLARLEGDAHRVRSVPAGDYCRCPRDGVVIYWPEGLRRDDEPAGPEPCEVCGLMPEVTVLKYPE